jgi:flagellar biosynthesis regulator FlbT
MSGLVLKLGPKERVLINGAVIENGDRRTRLSIVTPNANILRLRDALHPEEVTTPVRRVCYIAQLVLSGDVELDDARTQILRGMEQLSQVFTDPDSRAQLARATDSLVDGQIYQTLQSAAQLMPREDRLLAAAPKLSMVSRSYPSAAMPAGGSLSANLDAQVQRMAESPLQARDREYFRENIGNVVTASELVEDYRLRRVALSAFGLQDDLPNRAFIERVLSTEPGMRQRCRTGWPTNATARFPKRSASAARLPPRTLSPGFADRILARFDRQEFERSVGEQDEDLRLALTASRELPELAARDLQDTTAWLSVLGNPPLRRVFETALGLPASIGTLDLDRQVDEFREAADRILGFRDISRFADGAATEELVKNFTLRAQLASGPSPTVPGLAAITLLQASL